MSSGLTPSSRASLTTSLTSSSVRRICCSLATGKSFLTDASTMVSKSIRLRSSGEGPVFGVNFRLLCFLDFLLRAVGFSFAGLIFLSLSSVGFGFFGSAFLGGLDFVLAVLFCGSGLPLGFLFARACEADGFLGADFPVVFFAGGALSFSFWAEDVSGIFLLVAAFFFFPSLSAFPFSFLGVFALLVIFCRVILMGAICRSSFSWLGCVCQVICFSMD